jgi:hypothetical protein
MPLEVTLMGPRGEVLDRLGRNGAGLVERVQPEGVPPP